MKKLFQHLAAILSAGAIALLPTVATSALTGSPQQASLSLSSANSYVSGSTVSVTVSETSSVPVAGVEADFSYNPAQLQYINTDTSSSVFNTAWPSSGGNGTVTIARTQQSATNPTGYATIAVVNFKVLASSGTAKLTVLNSSEVDDSVTANNVCDASCAGGTVADSFQLTAATITPPPAQTSTPPTTGGNTPTADTKKTTTAPTTTTSSAPQNNSGTVLGASNQQSGQTPKPTPSQSSRHTSSEKPAATPRRTAVVITYSVLILLLAAIAIGWARIMRTRKPLASPTKTIRKASKAGSKKTKSTSKK